MSDAEACPHPGPGAELDFAALFAVEAPPAHDAAFVADVIRRSGRQRLAFELAWSGLVAALSALVLWAVGPVLAPVVRPLAGAAAVFAPIGLVAAAVLFLVHPRTAPI
jgi:hypothetical protein